MRSFVERRCVTAFDPLQTCAALPLVPYLPMREKWAPFSKKVGKGQRVKQLCSEFYIR